MSDEPDETNEKQVPEAQSISMIRDLIANQAPAADAPAKAPEAAAKPAEPAPAPAPRKDERSERWAALRDALNAEDDDEEDPVEAAETAPAERVLTPIERLRLRQAAEAAAFSAPAQPAPEAVEEDEITPYDDSVFGDSGTLDEPQPAPLADPALLTPEPEGPADPNPAMPRVWDTPADHQMSDRGKLFWRLGIYGTIVAVPVALLVTSPFSPVDTVAHYASATGCTMAGYFGVEGAKEGEPGYHASLDPNQNGIACEPPVQRRMQGNGSVAFVRAGD